MLGHCQKCGKKLKLGQIMNFTIVSDQKLFGLPIDMTVYRVCPECYEKLKEEHDFRQKGLKRCIYCGTVHSITEKCPTCGAP